MTAATPDQTTLRGVLDFLRQAEALKNTLRSAHTSNGRPESAAEHSWRLSLMALTVGPYFPAVDTARLLQLCIVHDLGEALHGDVPAPQQTADRGRALEERRAFVQLIAPLPATQQATLLELWDEYDAAATPAARLAKALDKLETILQHNQGDNPPDFDYAFNLHYGKQYTVDDPLIVRLRQLLDAETARRAEENAPPPLPGATAHDQGRVIFVTGAPGAGKSSTVVALRKLGDDLLVFDMDDLLPAASKLAGREVATDASTWPAYNMLWLAVLDMVRANRRPALLFTPIEPDDLPGSPASEVAARAEWRLFDCDDATRRRRLAARPGWTEAMIAEALADAASLRRLIPSQIETATQPVDAVARALLVSLGLAPATSARQEAMPAPAAAQTSTDYTISLSAEADPVVEEWLKQRIREFNNRYSPHHLSARTAGVEPLHVLVRTPEGELLGGLTASTYWQWLDIDDLWLPPALRGQGLGHKLLTLAEAEARRRGCTRAQLRTFDFQARGFYEKVGYRVVGVLEDYPPDGAMYWMRKELVAP